MTYTTDTAGRTHRVGYYLAFDGIATRLATHDMATVAGLSGTYEPCIVIESLTGGDTTLNRETRIAEQGGLSCSVIDSAVVRALLRKRGGTETLLNASVSSSATTIVLASGANTYADGSTVYIGRETITLGTGTAGSYAGCTRAVNGSTAATHSAGALISSVPLFWYTRDVALYAVHLDTGTEKALWHGSLSEAPIFRNGIWSLSMVGRINDFLNRPICTGWRDIQCTDSDYDSESDTLTLTISDADYYELAVPADGATVRLETGRGVAIFNVDSGDLSATELVIRPDNIVRGKWADIADDVPKVKQIGYVSERLGQCALMVALSVEGDGNNDSSPRSRDRLPGLNPDTSGAPAYFTRKRLGAAIPQAKVNKTSFEAAGRTRAAIWIDEPMRFGDWLATEVLWRVGGYVGVDSSGKLALFKFTPVSIRSAMSTLTTSGILLSDVSSVDEERDRLGRVVIQTNYDPLSREFRRRTELVFNDDAAIYGDRGVSAGLNSRGTWIGSTDEEALAAYITTHVELETYFDRERARQKYGGRRLSLILPWKDHETFVVGHRFAVTDGRYPDHAGNSGVASLYLEVIGVKPDFAAGTITVDAEEVPRGWLIAPAAEVASWSSPTLTLSTTGNLANGIMQDDTNPGQDFVVGSRIQVLDRSASPPFSTATTLTVTAQANTTLTTSGTPSFTPAAGDLVVQYDDTGDVGAENDVGADVEDFAFGADSSYEVGPTTQRAGSRWT